MREFDKVNNKVNMQKSTINSSKKKMKLKTILFMIAS